MESNFTNNFNVILKGCLKDSRQMQKLLYQQFYSYAMSICLRYAPNMEEAQEILNDSFLKVFKNIKQYNQEKPFRLWLRRILINTAIDYYRSRNNNLTCIEEVPTLYIKENPSILDDLALREILDLVQELPTAYRLVFNLYVMEGYKHQEIAEKLGISEGTSKSNLAKARKQLQRKLEKLYTE